MTAPDWFLANIARPRHAHFVEVEGARIHYQTWNATAQKPVLLFVHGHAAHSHWWDFIAPAFTEDYKVAAMDMSGAGESDHRDAYFATTFAKEIIAVATALGGNAIVVGHSFGGSMTRIAAWLDGSGNPDRSHPAAPAANSAPASKNTQSSKSTCSIKSIAIIDSAISRERVERMPIKAPKERVRYYATLEQGMRRFRLRPPQPCETDYALSYIASHTLRRTREGYCFKLDQAVFSKMPEESGEPLPDSASMIESLTCPVGFVYGDQSRFFTEDKVALLKQVIDADKLICINNAYHHLFLDQPLDFIQALKGLLPKLS